MRVGAVLTLLTLLIGAPRAVAQRPPPVLAGRVIVTVMHDSAPVEGALVRLAGVSARTDSAGRATLVITPGTHRLTVSRIGFAAFGASLELRPGQDTAVTVTLEAVGAELEAIVVQATRSERRIEEEPLRVEVLVEEEVDEKVQMTPGDITMMLNESSGLRVAVTSPSLGGASVRVQGMRGRYTQILADGLPLFGGQTGGLGLLQIPPMDLGGVEVIKGVASSLYGGSAMGGVINLIARRPAAEPVLDVLLNQTTLGGSDAVLYASRQATERLGYTLLAGAHRQSRANLDDDAWTDVPSYRRTVVRPRLFWTGEGGASLMLTAGTTLEEREGGTMPGRLAPDSSPYREELTTRRYDAGVVSRVPLGDLHASLRGSASLQSHHHTFGSTRERDRHVTWLGEATVARLSARAAYVAGMALQQERYRARDVSGVDYTFTTPGVFAQWTQTVTERSSVTLSGRIDRHSEYGTQATYRASLLERLGREWSLRASAGTGYFAPTPFTEETEVVGLSRLLSFGGLRAERARNATLDLAGAVRGVEVVGTAFVSRIARRVVASRRVFVPPFGGPDSTRMVLTNALDPRRNGGLELLARMPVGEARVTASYTFVASDEPLTPRHQAGVVIVWESEQRGRVGFETYYVGEQQLEDDPYRSRSKPNVHVGVLIERRLGPLRVWLNGENLLGFRQTTYAPLVRPTPGLGGRWTTDVWGPLEGRTFNFGLRL